MPVPAGPALITGRADPYGSCHKACVRSDPKRCGRIKPGMLLKLCARFQLQVPAQMAEDARPQTLVAYMPFIDKLRELQLPMMAEPIDLDD